MSFNQAWTGVQNGAPSGNAADLTTGSLTTTTGNTIVVGFTLGRPTPQAPNSNAISDNKGNTYTQIATQQISGSDWVGLYYCRNITGGAGHTITAHNGQSDEFKSLAAVELTGIDGTSDVTGGNSATATTETTGNVSTTVTDDLVAAFTASSGSNGTWHSGTGTVRSSVGNAANGATVCLATRDAVTAGSNSVTVDFNTENDAYAAVFGSFKVSGGGATFKPGRASRATSGVLGTGVF